MVGSGSGWKSDKEIEGDSDMKYEVQGGQRLKGRVKIQGAKNSAMRYIILPILAPGVFEFGGIPNISSCGVLLEMLEDMGAKVKWDEANKVLINSEGVHVRQISNKHFFHTSGAVYAVQAMVGKFGECVVENIDGRSDSGGDQIGRKLDMGLWGHLGISIEKSERRMKFVLKNKDQFKIDAKRTFGISTAGVLAGLFRSGRSEIDNPNESPEFEDLIKVIGEMGGRIKNEGRKLLVEAGVDLSPVRWTCLPDRHDLVTWVSMALATRSELTIENIDYKGMKLGNLTSLLEKLGAVVDFDVKLRECRVAVRDLRPVRQVFHDYPLPATEWQVLLAPVFARIQGKSEIVEGYYTDRLGHWVQLQKMGAQFEYYIDPNYPEVDGKPRAVRIEGVANLQGVELEGKDVRSVAAMLISGMAGVGKSVILDRDNNLDRGYEDFIGRARGLGAAIEIKQ